MLKILLVLFVVTYLVNGESEFVQQPLSVNAFVNSTITFSCTGRTSLNASNLSNAYLLLSITWLIDGKLIEDIVTNGPIDSGTFQSNLTIAALEEYNSSFVCCLFNAQILRFNADNLETVSKETIQSEHSYIHLQGVLSEATNLTIQFGQNDTILLWSPPHSLEGLDINYNITISATDTQIVSTVTNSNNYTISTMTKLIPCSNYSFIVQPWNEVGVTPATKITSYFPGGPAAPLVIDTLSVAADETEIFDSFANLVISLSVNTECFQQQNISFITTSTTQLFPVSISDFSQDVLILTVRGLPLNELLNLSLVLINSFGESSKSISINTFEVQALQIVNTTRTGRTCFRCSFLTGTQISGCYVSIAMETASCNCKVPSHNTSIIFDSSYNETFSDGCIEDLESGLHTIEVYSITNGSNIGDTVLISSSGVSLQGTECTQTITTSTSQTPVVVTMTTTSTVNISPTITVVQDRGTGIMTATLVISVFIGVAIILSSIVVSVYIYIKCHNKKRGGVLTITDRTHSTPVKIEEIQINMEGHNETDAPVPLPRVQVFTPINTATALSTTRSQSSQEDITREDSPTQQSKSNEVRVQEECLHNVLLHQTPPTGEGDSTGSSGSNTSVLHSVPPPFLNRLSGEYDHLD